MSILIKHGGFLTTVQDAGRFGKQQFGVPVSGAVDQRSLQLANILVDNPVGEAALEVTIMGPVIEFGQNNIIAITGGNLSPLINNAPAPMYRAILVKQGDVLSFSTLKTGCRAYVAFAGGLDIAPFMGSKSTYLRGKFGGFNGGKLQDNDVIRFVAPKTSLPNLQERAIQPEDFSSGEITLRVVRGPQDDYFTEKGLDTFSSSAYTITNESDRMGSRLEGEKIEHVKDGNIISDGIAFGSIQIPSSGMPIIMLADRQCTGGYTKIATVISMDLPLMAQAKPGMKVRFKEVNIDEAQDLYIDQFNRFKAYQEQFKQPVFDVAMPTRTYTITVNRNTYHVTVGEVPI